MMMLHALLVGASLIATSNETIWWRTDGAMVVGFRDTSECSLFLYDSERGLVFTWSPNGDKVAIQDSSSHFASGQPIMLTLQFDGTSTAVIAGVGENDYVSGDASESFEPLLREAHQITVKFADREIEFGIRGKMSKLLEAVDKCRHPTGRIAPQSDEKHD